MSANLSATLSSTTKAPSLLETDPGVTGALLCLYSIFFIVGLFGNLIVVMVVVKYKAMQTTTNRFIACLSVSDILLCLFAIPFTPTNAILTTWIFGEVMCRLVGTVLAISVFVSTFTSVAIAIDRYMIIVHPHTKRMPHRIQAILIAAIWITSVLISTPIAIKTYLTDEPDGTESCKENWDDDNALIAYNWTILTLQLIAPSFIIIVCYTAVSIKLHRRAKIKLGSRQEARARTDAQRNKKINKMLIAMVVIFIGCWLPLNTYHFFAESISAKHGLTVFLILHVIAMSSVMYNPFLYGWMNGNFRFYFRRIIPGLNKRRRLAELDESKNTTQTMVTKQERLDGSHHELSHVISSNNNVQHMSGALGTEERTPFIIAEQNGSGVKPGKQHTNQGFG